MATGVGDFRNSSEEISHWKSMALDYQERWQQIKDEFSEFQSSSSELESEYESQVKSLEKKNSDIVKQLERLKNENQELLEKINKHRHETSKHISELETRLSSAEETIASQKLHIVKLETENDKLENSSRAITASLEFIQQKLDEQTEMVTYLTFEKEDLAIEVERYREDLKDLQNDTNVRHMSEAEDKVKMPETPGSCPGTPLRIGAEGPRVFELHNTPLNAIKSADKTPASPLTPQACITAIGIVNDLMKRFGSIESKLASIKNGNKSTSLIRAKNEHPPPTPVATIAAAAVNPESCNGVASHARPIQAPSRRWSNIFRFSFFSGEPDLDKEAAVATPTSPETTGTAQH